MKSETLQTPDYLFEVSWEVCNKIGGIHTVISTKVTTLRKVLKNAHIMIGPDVLKEAHTHPEFIEDHSLFKAWRMYAAEKGLRIRVGRWNIPETPITILVDFTSLFPEKDAILTKLWEDYRLDSISGEWDYIESTLFGYAAGQVINSYVNFHCRSEDKIVAHFHEWMTGAGVLYLNKHTPQVGCVFTTHATVLGRCIAGNNYPLYDHLTSYEPNAIAHQFNVFAKQSIERIAANVSDAFTTVSDLTANECAHFLAKSVDVVTPNGFQDFIGDRPDFFKTQKINHQKFFDVAEAILAHPLDKNAQIIGIGGRYEFRNKGIDVFIDALGKLNKDTNLHQDIIAFILVPAGHHGASKELLDNLNKKDDKKPLNNRYTTHNLHEPHSDRVLRRIGEAGLHNSENNRVKIFFVPSYLNGDDGIFNVPYYDMLAALDISVFPSYYEPWGYTPLESLAFKVPTITTTLAGFGLWVKNNYKKSHPGIEIIKRTDTNDEEVINSIAKLITQYAQMPESEKEYARQNACDVAQIALWDNFIVHYQKAYSIALQKAKARYSSIKTQLKEEKINYIPMSRKEVTPNWNQMIVQRIIPEKLKTLEEISKNLWWCWNQDAIDLFQSLDAKSWLRCEYNPLQLLDMISLQRYQELENDKSFVARLEKVYKHFQEYMKSKDSRKGPGIAYFSMEYGLHSSLKIYSGGLGILAGDYLKEASDKSTKMTAVGLLYRYGYFTQRLSSAGDQVAAYEAQQFDKIPVNAVRDDNGNWMEISIAFPGRLVKARIWRVDVGRTELYLLDTDIDDNLPEDRSITHHLYGGDWENRLKQEILLGVGGIRLLTKLGISADVYHCNEGHAAMIGFERIRELMNDAKLSFDEAIEAVRSSSLFTTHTPVPAGHDAFDEGLLRKYISHYPERYQVDWSRIMGLGRVNQQDPNEKFSMSNLAVNLSQEVNGVSWLHGKVSRHMFNNMFPGYLSDELHISYVTNGVHYPTWASPRWKELFEREFGGDFADHHYDKSCFSKIQKVANAEIWEIRNELRRDLVEHIKERVASKDDVLYYLPREIVQITETLDATKLTIGFARRFATYKRAHLLFKNLDTLNDIVNHPTQPVQFIFAGKAHPADKAGQDFIKMIVEISKYPQFLGKILFIENYDMELARKMVQGVDIWLNTPTRPLEASGTSGEKAVMNGVMHFSVLDGWWVEGYQPDAGWMLPLESRYENDDFQNELDAETIYSIIENEMAPLYYQQNEKNNVPAEWVQRIKNSIEKVASNFTTNRMLVDYEERFYFKLQKRHNMIKDNDYAKAKEITEWKRRILHEWNSVEILSAHYPEIAKTPVLLGEEYSAEVMLTLGKLSANEVGVELIFVTQVPEKAPVIVDTKDFTCATQEGSVATYTASFTANKPGAFSFGIRIYPKHELLPHRQDFCLVKWL